MVRVVRTDTRPVRPAQTVVAGSAAPRTPVPTSRQPVVARAHSSAAVSPAVGSATVTATPSASTGPGRPADRSTVDAPSSSVRGSR
jgi:hypothetical protein